MAAVRNTAPLNIEPIYISWASGNCCRNCINADALFPVSFHWGTQAGVTLMTGEQGNPPFAIGYK